MSKLFRSEEMRYLRLRFMQESSVTVIRALGHLGKLHLVDLGVSAQDSGDHGDHGDHGSGDGTDEDHVDLNIFYKKRVVECVTAERKLQWFENQIESNGVQMPDVDSLPTPEKLAQVQDVLVDVSAYIKSVEKDLVRNLEFSATEQRRQTELAERQLVLRICQSGRHNELVAPEEEEARVRGSSLNSPGHSLELNPHAQGVQMEEIQRRHSDDLKQPFLLSESVHQGDVDDPELGSRRDNKLRFHANMVGVIPVNQQAMFSRMLFRVTRGNTVSQFIDIDEPFRDPTTGEMTHKSVFIIAYVCGSTGVLQRRISKMCDLFRANVYDIPVDPRDFPRELQRVSTQLAERSQVLDRTQREIRSILRGVASDSRGESSSLRFWQEALRQEKLVCDALRKCYVPRGSNVVTAEGWVPAEDIESVSMGVQDAVRRSGAQEPAIHEIHVEQAQVPTYFKTDKYTSAFQGIVNTYGVPRYQEVNPGLFTIVTFPFLFGVMYGDMGHGTCLFMFGLWLVYNEEKFLGQKRKNQLPELLGMAFGGRYLIVLMGFFAMYCGSIYNDCFSVPFRLFESQWDFLNRGNMSNVAVRSTVHSLAKVYPYGVDPSWYHTTNELTFFNSLKMKISVTLGVTQMTFGIVLGLFNHVYFGDWLSVWAEFIPQLMFMMCTFGYMIFLIVYKLCVDWTQRHSNPPNLIQTMINMFLSPGSVKASEQLYIGQGAVQGILVLLALVAVPWMLAAKPIVLKRRMKAEALRRSRASQGHRGDIMAPHMDDDDEKQRDFDEHGGHGGQDEHDEHDDDHGHDFSEIVIHQAIHTIEFVLGAVSNTASYLRLWALSLAHAELSNVFFSKIVMEYGLATGSPIMMVVAFGAWAGATFAVLLCMDVLECFLHALRLHWVEFQNKFYNGDGYKYMPFTFEPVEDDD